MLVMLGPSGSGKTTLLKVLGSRLKSDKVEGTVLYNDEPHSKFIKRRTGFVTQDDVLFANLTVKETLVYAARLRLPDTYTREDKVNCLTMLTSCHSFEGEDVIRFGFCLYMLNRTSGFGFRIWLTRFSVF